MFSHQDGPSGQMNLQTSLVNTWWSYQSVGFRCHFRLRHIEVAIARHILIVMIPQPKKGLLFGLSIPSQLHFESVVPSEPKHFLWKQKHFELMHLIRTWPNHTYAVSHRLGMFSSAFVLEPFPFSPRYSPSPGWEEPIAPEAPPA